MTDSAQQTDQSRSKADEDFRPTASLETLQQRARLLAEIRKHFDARGYWEVETPILSRDVIVDAWLEPFLVQETTCESPRLAGEAGERDAELFLQTSPEFGMKRLLAAGATAIYQITRAFRRGEIGRFHNPEFTIVEWYRAGDSYHLQMDCVEELVVKMFSRAREISPIDQCDPAKRLFWGTVESPFDRVSYDEAFEQFAGSRVLDLPPPLLAALAEQSGLTPPATLRRDDRDGWLNLLLAELVEPNLGRDRPVFLYDYPASQAALAQVRDDDPRLAKRFELYIGGIELCNGYEELTDAEELRERMSRQAELRAGEGLRALPTENRLLEAMRAGLPACSGVALGFDRLAMLLLGKTSLAEVCAFPFSRA